MAVGAVEILRLGQSGGRINGGGKRVGQLPLALNGAFDLLPARLQIAQILKTVGQCAKPGVVHGAVQFLAVAGDEGNGVSLINQIDDIPYICLALFQLVGQNLYDGVHSVLL